MSGSVATLMPNVTTTVGPVRGEIKTPVFVNMFEVEARFRKVCKLFHVLQANGLTTVAKLMTDDHWAQLALAAEVRVPSVTTREMVLMLCREEF